MKRVLLIAIAGLLVGCSSSTAPGTVPEAKTTAVNADTPSELKSLIGMGGRAGEAGLEQAGYEFRNGAKSETSSITRWRGKGGACVEVTTTDGKYGSIKTVDAGKCADDGSAVAATGNAGAKRTVCGVIVGDKRSSYLCEVEENRQGTTVLRFPDTILKLTWNLGSTSVRVQQDGGKVVTVKYGEGEGETNFRLDDRTFFYTSNPDKAEFDVKNFRKEEGVQRD